MRLCAVRLSEGTVEALIARDGSLTNGLRAAADAYLATPPPPAPKEHRHRRQTLVRTDWVDGVKIQTWSCECGHEMSD